MTSQFKVSILIPTFKRPQLIIEAIQSCLNQTYLPFEIIIGDDSPDKVTEIEIEKIKNNATVSIRYIHNNPALRQAGNINMLFDSVNGDKVVLLHDDDMLMPEAIEEMLQCFCKDSRIKAVYGKQYIISNDGVINYAASQELNRYYYRTDKEEGLKLTSLEAGMLQQFPNDGYMLNLDVIKKIRFRTYNEMGFIGDGCEYDFGLQVGQQGFCTYFLNKYTAKYRESESSMSKTLGSNFSFYTFKILESTSIPLELTYLKEKKLCDVAPVAIAQATAMKSKIMIRYAVRIYFSKYHRRRILSLGGIKRLALILLTFTKIQLQTES